MKRESSLLVLFFIGAQGAVIIRRPRRQEQAKQQQGVLEEERTSKRRLDKGSPTVQDRAVLSETGGSLSNLRGKVTVQGDLGGPRTYCAREKSSCTNLGGGRSSCCDGFMCKLKDFDGWYCRKNKSMKKTSPPVEEE